MKLRASLFRGCTGASTKGGHGRQLVFPTRDPELRDRHAGRPPFPALGSASRSSWRAEQRHDDRGRDGTFPTRTHESRPAAAHPDGYLLCYPAKAARFSPMHTTRIGVYVATQLGNERRDTIKEQELCVPSRVTDGL